MLPQTADLTAQSTRLASAVFARRTLEQYAFDWRTFSEWCAESGRTALPADAGTLDLFLTQALECRKIKTARHYLSAILHHHVQHGCIPPDSARARAILAGAQRLRCEHPVQKSALSVDQLALIIRYLDRPEPYLTRDRAVLLFGFATALRRSSIADARLDHVRLIPGKGMIVHVPREKQDQTGQGRDIGVPYARRPDLCAVRALEQWLKFRSRTPGYLFDGLQGKRPVPKPERRMHPNTVARIVKRAVLSIGLDPAHYGGHSLRAGFATAALEAGAGEILTARHTGHRSLATLRMYLRPQDPFRGNACTIIGL